jgi:putative DNA methylase
MTHHLLRVYYYAKAGDEATAELLRKIGPNGEISRDLAYRLFNVCEKKKWSQEAQAITLSCSGGQRSLGLRVKFGEGSNSKSLFFKRSHSWQSLTTNVLAKLWSF